MLSCPKCKMVSPDSAQRCDCGYDFITKSQEKSYIEKKAVATLLQQLDKPTTNRWGAKTWKILLPALSTITMMFYWRYRLLLKNGVLPDPGQLGEIAGMITGTCLIPAIGAGIWQRYSKNEWSLLGTFTRYYALLIVWFLIAVGIGVLSHGK